MYYYVMQDELYHHGVMGQKWGVRRYQNEDGSLTEKGRKHREQLVKMLRKADPGADTSEKTAIILANDKALRLFNKNSDSYKELQKSMHDYYNEKDSMNRYANDMASKKVGASSGQLLAEGRTDEFAQYFNYGVEFTNQYIKDNPKYTEALNKYKETSKKYEKDVTEFVDWLLGDYAKEKSVNDLAIAYDMKTGKIRNQTMSEKVSHLAYRMAGGRINN